MRLFAQICLLFVAFSPIACSAQDGPMRYLEGEQYRKVNKVSEPEDASKITVTEVFWYGCGHCYAFEPYMRKWAETKPGDVVFERMPNSLGRPVGLLHSRAYYTAEQLGIEKQFTPKMFAAMHDQRLPMSTESAIGSLATQLGIDEAKFSSTFEGFAVDSQVRRAEQQSRDWGVTGTPTVIVGGKYMTAPSMAHGSDEAIDVVRFLVDKVRAERK